MNLDDYEFQKVGRIVEYFPATQTATVRICNNRTFSTTEDTELQIDQGLLEDVPVLTPGGGDFHITFPIKPGDSCLLSFSESGYDHWFFDDEDSAKVRSDGQPQAWTRRRFSLADGFAQVGYNNLKTALTGYSEVASEWRNANRSTRIALHESGGVFIKAADTHINISPSGNVTITAPKVVMTGDLDVVGTINAAAIVAPSFLANGVEVAAHNHTNPEGGNVGPMQ